MTQEEKKLLLKDLSTRLPYGVKIKRSTCPINLSVTGILGEYVHHTPYYVGGNIEIKTTKIDEVKPYLRPMSSMTEEEKIELCIRAYAPDEMKTIDEKLYVIQTNAKNATDFYNEHHIDYRGLIPMGLALEAPEGMYNIKSK